MGKHRQEFNVEVRDAFYYPPIPARVDLKSVSCSSSDPKAPSLFQRCHGPSLSLAPGYQRSNTVVGCYNRTTIVGGYVDWPALVSLGHFSQGY
jgi:hypothetical protein